MTNAGSTARARIAVAVPAGVLGVATALCAACGVTFQSSPHVIPRADVPFGLMKATTTTLPPAPVPSTAIMEVFLVQSGHLGAVNRLVQAPLTVSTALDALIAGPTGVEAFFGTTTAIPSGTAVHSTRVSGPVATVDLSQSFSTVGGQNQILAIAQIVYTATQVPGVTQVAFELDGTPVEVPAADGTLQQRPVGRLAYAEMAPGIPVTGSPAAPRAPAG